MFENNKLYFWLSEQIFNLVWLRLDLIDTLWEAANQKYSIQPKLAITLEYALFFFSHFPSFYHPRRLIIYSLQFILILHTLILVSIRPTQSISILPLFSQTYMFYKWLIINLSLQFKST